MTREQNPDGAAADGPVKFVPLDTERLARMAGVDGSWWQETDRQIYRQTQVWAYAFYAWIGALIGLVLGLAGCAYQIGCGGSLASLFW